MVKPREESIWKGVPGLLWLKRGKLQLLLLWRSIHNAWVLRRPPVFLPETGLPALNELRKKSLVPTDFSDHLVPVFLETLQFRPRLIVELGTRGGESTTALKQAARLCGGRMLSVDLDEAPALEREPFWEFVRSDDVEFAGRFPDWCRERGLDPVIHLLFIDTSHEYGHTAREMAAWFPFLAPQCRVIFHDTHLHFFYRRLDRTLGIGWENQRGVIRAIEEFFGTRYDESRAFLDFRKSWLVRHWPHSGGLTILDRLPWVE